MKERRKKLLIYVLSGVLLLAFIATRLWRNRIIPHGWHIDEIATTYDAWSLANYGVDRHLKSWPIYLINFGGGQSVLYCYLCAALFKLFGFSYGLIRIPAVLFSFLTLVFGMLTVRKLFPDKPLLMWIAGILIVICPYFILSSRYALDCNLMLGMSTVFLYCMICAMEGQKYRWYVLAGVTGGLILYTYALAYLAVPVFLVLSLIYVIWTRRFFFTHWVAMAIPMGFLAFPLILEQYINFFDLDEIRLGVFTVTKMLNYRGNEVGHLHWQNFTNTLKSVFVGDWLPYNSIPGFPNLYYITIPLAMIGAAACLVRLGGCLKRREFTASVYPFFWFLALLLVMSNVYAANTNTVNGIFFSVIFLTIEGISILLAIGKKWGRIAVGICSALYCIGFMRFGSYYYLGGYSTEHPTLIYFDITVEEAVEFLEEHPQYKHKGTYMAEDPIYFAISTLASPYDLRMEENEHLLLDYYYCGSLPALEDGYNYIVRDIYGEYAQELRDLGYTEIKYTFYSLFYQEQYQEISESL